MEYHRPGLTFRQWEEILKSWLLMPRASRVNLLQENPDIFSPIDNASKSDITVSNDIIFVRDAWKNIKKSVEPQTLRLYTLLDEFSHNEITSHELSSSY